MPYSVVHVPAKLFMSHKGIKVFHTYKEDYIENGPRLFSYSFDQFSYGNNSFDVRKLPNWTESTDKNDIEHIKEVLRQHIEQLLTEKTIVAKEDNFHLRVKEII